MATFTVGTSGNDTLTGTAADDIIDGREGDDLLRQTLGADTLDGGAGFDSIDFTQTGVTYGGAVGVTVNLATGVSDLNNSAASTDAVLVSIERVFGSAGSDVLTGGDAAHAIPDSLGNLTTEAFRPFGGNDTITGGNPVDGFSTRVEYTSNTSGQPVTVDLGAGTASDGFGGTDTLINVGRVFGGAGADMLTGGGEGRGSSGTFFEILRGNAGNDTLDGGDSFHGGVMGGDRADYGNSGGSVIANLGTSSIVVGADTILGGTAKDGFGGIDTLIDIDQVYGGSGADTLVGGADNDVFSGGSGNDYIDGGGGSDNARYDNDLAAVIVNLSAGNLIVGATTVAGGTALDGSGSTDTLISIESVRGSDFNDYIRGSDAAGTVERLEGLAGNDTIDGGAGIDFASWAVTAPALGGVNVSIASGGGVVSDGYGGTDTLINIEGLEGTNSGDTLTGGAGVQWFRGRGGDDVVNGGGASDWVSYRPDPAGVTVNLDTGTATDGWDGPGGALGLGGMDTLISIENVEGSNFNDILTGNSGVNELRGLDGNDKLNGGAGNDTMVGGAGNDTYVVNAAGDVVTELPSGGVDTVQSSVTIAALAASVEKLTLTGTGAINGTGNTFNNKITGNSGANQLVGGAGNDTLKGNGGADTLHGSSGDDTLKGGGGNDALIYQSADTSVQGGSGTDTLRIDGNGVTVDLTLIANTVHTDIEKIDLTGSGDNTLTLARSDVLAISSTTDTLKIDGNAGDTVNAGSGWGDFGVSGAYHEYHKSGAILLVDTDILAQNIFS